MTVDAGSGLEYPSPLRNNIAYRRRLPLLLNPAVELIARLDINAQKHFCVLCPAILRALAQVEYRLARLDTPHAELVRDTVCPTRQSWDPESRVRTSTNQP